MIWKKKYKLGGLTLYDFKVYYKPTEVKAVEY